MTRYLPPTLPALRGEESWNENEKGRQRQGGYAVYPCPPCRGQNRHCWYQFLLTGLPSLRSRSPVRLNSNCGLPSWIPLNLLLSFLFCNSTNCKHCSCKCQTREQWVRSRQLRSPGDTPIAVPNDKYRKAQLGPRKFPWAIPDTLLTFCEALAMLSTCKGLISYRKYLLLFSCPSSSETWNLAGRACQPLREIYSLVSIHRPKQPLQSPEKSPIRCPRMPPYVAAWPSTLLIVVEFQTLKSTSEN